MDKIYSVMQCISEEEKKKRMGVVIINIILWVILSIIAIISFVFMVVGLYINVSEKYNTGVAILSCFLLAAALVVLYYIYSFLKWLGSELYMKNLLCIGTAANKQQFPEVWNEINTICNKFSVSNKPIVVVINEGVINAFALRVARKKIIVLYTEILEGVIDKPEELRFILGHELGHILLDFGGRGIFEKYKPAHYQSARELTCDNLGCASSGDLKASRNVLKRLAGGNKLFRRLNDKFLIHEANYVYSGITGWWLKQRISHPPVGKRIENIVKFYKSAA